jgi:type IX secretion system PorP/SprF family membrane protein
MNSVINKIMTLVMVASATVATAQQDVMFTHYMYNTLAVNPAYAGSREALTVTAIGRTQWEGFKGAPGSTTITAHTPLGKGMALV